MKLAKKMKKKLQVRIKDYEKTIGSPGVASWVLKEYTKPGSNKK